MLNRVAVLLALAIVSASACANENAITIGVLALHGEQGVESRWAPTAEYLQGQIPEYRFVVRPLGHGAIEQALKQRELDFVLTSSGQYVEIMRKFGVSALATLRRNEAGESSTLFGAVIFTRQDRGDIDTIHDLKGKSFMADSRPDCCFYVAWREFKAHDIDPFTGFSHLEFENAKEENIVYAVAHGLVDAGAVRTGLLERMAAQGRIRLVDFGVVNARFSGDFPLLHSTRLYPEWPFAKAAKTGKALAMRVQTALLALPRDHPAARAGLYAGWTAPLDYRSVENLFQEIGIGPYASGYNVAWVGILRGYWHWLLAAALALVATTGTTAYALHINRRLKLSKRSLEIEFEERCRVEDALRESEGTLHDLHDITAAHRLDFDAKLRALLAMGSKRFGLPVGILSHIEGDRYDVIQAISPDNSIVSGQVFSLGQTYCIETLRTDEPVGFEHAAESEWRTHPAYEFCRLEAYLGIRLEVAGEIYGTLNFMSPEARKVRYTETDKKILKLMAQWVESELNRRNAEETMRMLSTSLEGAADAVAITDRDGRIEYANPAFALVTGYSRDEMLGKTPSFLRSGHHDEAFYRDLWQTILQGRVFHALFTNRRKDGSLYYEDKTITPLTDASGGITHFVSTGRDVTAQRREEERSRQHQAEIAHSARLSAMGEMAASLAHELSQPLAGITNYVQGCLRRLRAGTTDPSDLGQALEQIALYASQSGEIIGHLRAFLRKSGPRRRPADINQIVREAADLAKIEARQRRVRLTLELASELPPVLVDTIQVQQVVVNLVHNAVVAIDGAACVERWVNVSSALGRDGKVEVTVRDSGPGLPAEDPEQLFQPFFSTKANGMGLGLAICRSIVEAHGGELRASPDSAGGAAFQFSLSVSRSEAAQ